MKTAFGALLFLALASYKGAVAQTSPSDPPPQTPPVATTSHMMTGADWPKESFINNEQGTVTIRYRIETDGSVSECTVTMTSGFQRLDDAACMMVKMRWKFRPAMRDGVPVAVTIPATVNFTLR